MALLFFFEGGGGGGLALTEPVCAFTDITSRMLSPVYYFNPTHLLTLGQFLFSSVLWWAVDNMPICKGNLMTERKIIFAKCTNLYFHFRHHPLKRRGKKLTMTVGSHV